jgi:hypothetical protein
VTGHKPLQRQNSPWLGEPDRTMDFGDGIVAHYFKRNVGDGTLWAMVGHEPIGPNNELRWHLSISFRDNRNELSRYPSWDEQVHAVRELMPQGVTFAMILPPDDDGYVALHDTTFHWHEFHDEESG